MQEATRLSGQSPPPTTISHFDGRKSLFLESEASIWVADPLGDRYRAILGRRRLDWDERHRLLRRLGAGGQGVVFLAERLGADEFRLPVALKVFSPEPYPDAVAYDAAMARMARVAARVAQIQQDNLIDVQNVVAADGVRVMEMEWIDGYDLLRLMSREMFDRTRARLDGDRWTHLNDVVITAGVSQPRLKPGIAIAVLRDCLAALSALHRQGVVHCDIKPSNIMLKRTGNAKLVDIGAAFSLDDPPESRACTPSYAAPEVLEGEQATVRSDLASLGYVLIEMLSGAPPTPGKLPLGELLEAKRSLVQRLAASLPEEVVRNELLMSLIAGLIAPDPADRFPSADAADLVEQGAANFQRQLVRGNLASEYDSEIRAWLVGLE